MNIHQSVGQLLGIAIAKIGGATDKAEDAATAAEAAQTAAETAQGKAEAAQTAAEATVPVEETVTGSAPTITGAANTRYICGEVSSLSFTPSGNGICIVRFSSGSTPAVLTLPTGANAIQWPSWFDPTSLEASAIYELCVEDGIYGLVTLWQ